ncbi:MAG: hypothetical protein ACTH0C_12665, partial [Actinomycetaceae bacterium]
MTGTDTSHSEGETAADTGRGGAVASGGPPTEASAQAPTEERSGTERERSAETVRDRSAETGHGRQADQSHAVEQPRETQDHLVARDVVRALVESGVRDVVLAPGSRSAPLAHALHSAEGAGWLRITVRI